MPVDVLLVPGFGGGATQPLLLRLQKALAARERTATPVALTKRRPQPTLAAETEELAALWRDLTASKGAIIGRSFGGRVAVRLATRAPVPALVLLGFPVRPPGKRRIEDERALQALTCRTLILQGENDEFGAPDVIAELIKDQPNITLEVIPGAKHAYGRTEAQVVARAAAWL